MAMTVYHSLSHLDCLTLLELIEASLVHATKDTAVTFLRRLHQLLPYEFSAAGFFSGSPESLYNGIINIDFPPGFLEAFCERSILLNVPVVARHISVHAMQYWGDTVKQMPKNRNTAEVCAVCEDFGVRNFNDGYTHGIWESKPNHGTIFCYSGLERCQRTERILELVIPHFHCVVQRIASGCENVSHLSLKETEVLLWIKEGKSNWDISRILGISERTVKFHVCNILRKLDAVSRTHALAKALSLGIIELD